MNTKALRQKVLDLAIHGKLVPPACRQAGKSLENIPAEKEGQWFVYVIECVDGSFYKGFTTDLIKRYKQHCAGIGAEWTKTHKPKQLFYWEIHYSEKSAIEREKYLKSGCGREWFKNEVVDKPENWESATVLLEKIRAEKAEKIKKGLPAGRCGELKADKKDSFIFVGSDKRHYEQFADGSVKDIEDEIPFEVPEGWTWCRLGEVCELKGGKRIPAGLSATKEKTNHIYIRVTDMQNNSISDADLVYITDEIFEKIQRYTINKDDLYLTIAGTIGRVGEVPEIFDGMNLTENALKLTNISICKKYLMQIINTKLVQDYFESTYHQVAMPKLSLINASKTIIPLPPLAEQERIVSVIKSIFSQIDTLDQNKSDLQTAIKQTKSKILDLAIHGKLVPQDPNDEPAEELLKRIATSDNRPYEKVESSEIDWTLPNNWCLCHFGDIATVINGKNQSKVENPNGKYPIYGSGGIMGRADDYICPENCTIIGRKGSINNPIFVEEKFWNVDTAFGLCPSEAILPKFLFYFCEYFDFTTLDSSTTLPSLTKTNIQQIIFALPPIEEQKRILDKTVELFGKLDEIVLNLV